MKTAAVRGQPERISVRQPRPRQTLEPRLLPVRQLRPLDVDAGLVADGRQQGAAARQACGNRPQVADVRGWDGVWHWRVGTDIAGV